MGRCAAGPAANGADAASGLRALFLRRGRFLVLVHAFVVNDFTVRYVADNSNSALPMWYRVGATGAPMKAHCCCGCSC
ncbi:hypothetical protein UA70_27790 [Raoultella planticola]|nr:hypothetical protein UA70_27790 [Raoultella planticola]